MISYVRVYHRLSVHSSDHKPAPRFLYDVSRIHVHVFNSVLYYQQIFDGNVDGSSDAENTLEPPVVTRCLRIEAVTWYNWISLRLEAMGCLA